MQHPHCPDKPDEAAPSPLPNTTAFVSRPGWNASCAPPGRMHTLGTYHVRRVPLRQFHLSLQAGQQGVHDMLKMQAVQECLGRHLPQLPHRTPASMRA